MANPPDTDTESMMGMLPRRRSLPIIIPQSPIPHFRAPAKSKYPNLGFLIQDHEEEDKILRESKEQSEAVNTFFQQQPNSAIIQTQETDLNAHDSDKPTDPPARVEDSPQQRSSRSSRSRSVSIPEESGKDNTSQADIEGGESVTAELCLAQEAIMWQSKLLKICNIYPANCAAH